MPSWRDRAHKTLDACLHDLYPFAFFGERQATFEAFLARTVPAASDSRFARVFVPSRRDVAADHVMKRVPVYYGAARTEMYNEATLKAVQGAGTRAALAVDRAGVFCIAGNVPLLARPSTTVIAVHGRGLNFETPGTRDYATFVERGRLRRAAVARELSRRVRLWLAAAVLTARDAHATGLHVRLALMGLGRFAKALDARTTDGKVLAEALLAALDEAADALAADNVLVEVFDRDNVLAYYGVGQRAEDGRLRRTRLVPGCSLFCFVGVDAMSPDEGPASHLVVGRRALCVLNAWDDVAFIGNGGREDPSVDAFLVAGCGLNGAPSSAAFAAAFANASYLQNPCFHPEWNDPDTWVEVPWADDGRSGRAVGERDGVDGCCGQKRLRR